MANAHLPPETVDSDILTSLRVLANVRAGDKLAVRPLAIQSSAWSGAIARWWRGEGRAVTLEYLTALFNSALERAAVHAERANSGRAQNVMARGTYEQYMTGLSAALIGVNNLAVTYCTDQPTYSQLCTIIERVNLRIHVITDTSLPKQRNRAADFVTKQSN